jgi:hypothetical protein
MSIGQKRKMIAVINKIKLGYSGKEVTAHKLTVSSEIPIAITTAWEKVQTSALLEFIAKGKVTFKPMGGHFPEIWKEKSHVATKMLLYGFIPFGGIHTLCFEKIDNENKFLLTTECDKVAKVWKHKISMRKLSENTIHYEDEIIMYGGALTSIVSWWAKSFYKYRQKRWQLVATKDKRSDTR